MKKQFVLGVSAFTALLGFTNLGHVNCARFLDDTQDDQTSFQQFIAKFGRNYGTTEEYNARFQTFKANKAKIDAHNADSLQTSAVGINKFSDWTTEEFKSILGYKMPATRNLGSAHGKPTGGSTSSTTTITVATTIDWRTSGAVTAVKDQGQCGSCWAFSTTGSLEGFHQIKSGTLVSLSEQQLVDCSTANAGCNGGSMVYAAQYAQSNPLETEAAYPYVATQQACNYNQANGVVSAVSVNQIAQNDNAALMQAVNLGPISVAVEADQTAFQYYTTGIISSGCGTNLDHGVLIVGYGSGYWIVKNSWGSSWGESGYVQIADQTGYGVCGINMQPSYATTN